MSNKAKILAELYRRRKITLAGLRKAKNDGVITEQEYLEIVGAE